jgi:PPOX class probable F420-dependent enzyme
MEPKEMREHVRNARVARLATVGAAQGPHIVPIVFALWGETIYFAVDEKPKRSRRLQRLRNIEADDRVSILVDEYADDWARLWWVRLDGRARVLPPGQEQDRAIALLQAKYEQYRVQPPGGPAVAVEIERWRGWASTAG